MSRRALVFITLAIVALVIGGHDTFAAPITLNFSGSVTTVVGGPLPGIFNTSQTLSGSVTVESTTPDLDANPRTGVYAAGVTGSIGGYSFGHVDPPFPSVNNAIHIRPSLSPVFNSSVTSFWEDVRELSSVGQAPDHFFFVLPQRVVPLPSDAIPNVPIIGSGGFWTLQLESGFLQGDNFQLGRSVEPPPPPKDPAVVAMHRARALQAEASLTTLSLFGTLSGAGSISDAVHSLLASAIESTGTRWGTVISVILGTVGAGLVGGPLGLAVGSTYALMTAYYEAIRVVETKLANDPPDPNFNEVYQYSNAAFSLALGSGNHVDSYFQGGFAALIRHIECRQGELTSNERAQGALQAGATAAVLAQSAARDRFAADCVQHAQSAGAFIGSLPDFLSSNGLDSGIPNIALAYGVFDETAAQLAPIPEPGTISLFLISAGALGVAWRRAHRIKQ